MRGPFAAFVPTGSSAAAVTRRNEHGCGAEDGIASDPTSGRRYGRVGATRGGGLVVEVLSLEKDQPSKLPSGGLRLVAPHEL